MEKAKRLLDINGNLVKTATDEDEAVDAENTGDRVILRTVMPADKPRNTEIAVCGHMWEEQYRSGSLKWNVESGMWGIFRIRQMGSEKRKQQD